MLQSDALGPHGDTALFRAITHGLLDRLARRKKSAREAEALGHQIAALSHTYPTMLASLEDALRKVFPRVDPATLHAVAVQSVLTEVRALVTKFKVPKSNRRDCWNILFIGQAHRLKEALRAYPPRRAVDARFRWLRANLPSQLERLKADGCPCSPHVDCPSDKRLKDLAFLSPAHLILAILAHHHGTSERQLKKEWLQAKRDIKRYGGALREAFPPTA